MSLICPLRLKSNNEFVSNDGQSSPQRRCLYVLRSSVLTLVLRPWLYQERPFSSLSRNQHVVAPAFLRHHVHGASIPSLTDTNPLGKHAPTGGTVC